MSQLFTHRQTHAPTPLLFHSPTLTSPNAVRSTRNENKRLEFRVWHQIEFSSHRPPTPSVSASSFFCFCFSSSLPHRSVLSFKPKTEKKKKNLEEELIFFPSKTNLMEKKKKNSSFFCFLFYVFIYIYICFSNSRHNVYLYSNPSSLPGSVCEHGVTWAGLSAHTALHLSCVHFKHRYKEMRLFWLRERPPSRNQW